MNNKYIDKDTYEIVNNVFEDDEEIADTISILNKKGYHTLFCCSGHVKDFRLYEKYPINTNHSKIGSYTVDNGILIPYQYTVIYIKFDKNYNLSNLPDGFFLEEGDNIVYKDIYYYNDNNKIDPNDIQNEINLSNKLLFEWAKSLKEIEKNQKRLKTEESLINKK